MNKAAKLRRLKLKVKITKKDKKQKKVITN